jgi:hypothetical protein
MMSLKDLSKIFSPQLSVGVSGNRRVIRKGEARKGKRRNAKLTALVFLIGSLKISLDINTQQA